MHQHPLLLNAATLFRRTRPTWFRVATARPCVLPVFEQTDQSPAHESYKWMSRIRRESGHAWRHR